MAKKRNKKIRTASKRKIMSQKNKAKRNKKPSKKSKKVLVKKSHRVKYRKAAISPKAKLLYRVSKKIIKLVKKPIAKNHLKNNKPKRKKTEINLLEKSFFKPKIKVIGIGGGGSSIVSEIGKSLDKASFIIADTDTRNFKDRRHMKYFLFGQKITHGLGTGLNPALGRMAAEQEKEKITKLFEGQDMVIFVASLGGGVGSGAAPVFAEISKKFPGISLGIFTLPFKFEGKNKYRIATKALFKLRESLNVSITIANEKIFKVIDANTAITQAFSMVNKNLIESLESLIDLIYNPGIINIDFADLKATLGEKGNLAFLNTAQASGKDKIEKIKKTLLHNHLYSNNNFNVQKILFNISGDKNLSMLEVDRISKIISEKSPKAKIIFGISKNPKYKNKIKVTILMTGPNFQENQELLVAPKIEGKIKKIKAKKNKKKFNKPKGEIIVMNPLPQVSNRIPISVESSIKSSVIETISSAQNEKKDQMHSSSKTREKTATIRRTALEIKKAQEIQENEKSQQEKEWEIPAFLRKIKFKP